MSVGSDGMRRRRRRRRRKKAKRKGETRIEEPEMEKVL